MMPMQISKEGLELLKEREGVRNHAYQDSKGIWTIGVGHTGPEVKEGLVWTDAEVDEALEKDVGWAEKAINDQVSTPLTQSQFDALVSLVFNIGVGAFRRSTVLRWLKVGNFEGAAQAILMWNKPREILPRRRGEYQQFKYGRYFARA
jgi:lysozyme